MSRAFMKEDDGWAFCQEKGRDCMFADAQGACGLRRCKYEPETSQKREENVHADPETPVL